VRIASGHRGPYRDAAVGLHELLTLMSALALTLCTGSAVCSQSVATYRRVRSCRGAVLTRLYSPLTALGQRARRDRQCAVSFERVFGCSDLVPLIQEKSRCGGRAGWPRLGRIRRRAVRITRRRQGLAGLAGRGRRADDRAETKSARNFVHRQPGQLVALVGSSGGGKSTIASLLGPLYDIDLGACASTALTYATSASPR